MMLVLVVASWLWFLQSVISWHHHRPPAAVRWTRLLATQKKSKESGPINAMDDILQSILSGDIYEDDETSLRLSSLSDTAAFDEDDVMANASYEDEDDDAESLTHGAPLKQLQLRFNCDEVDSDDLSELLFEVGTLSVSVEVQSEKDILNDETRWMELVKTKSWQTALLRANFPSSFNADGLLDILAVTFPGIEFECTVVDVENKDWVSDVQKTWLPQRIGNLTVRFPWHSQDLLPEEILKDVNHQHLVLEGGAAFGTGDHPTTRLCCRWLEKELRQNEESMNSACKTVLDYGCGSAILGLAALKYGAIQAVGVDIDKDALVSAANNCAMNNLSMDFYLAIDDDDQSDEEKSVVNNVLKGYQSTAFVSVQELEKEGPVFDLVVANILAPILMHLAPTFHGHMKIGGKIALSGLVSPQAETVVTKFKELFDDVKVEESEEGWALITATKQR